MRRSAFALLVVALLALVVGAVFFVTGFDDPVAEAPATGSAAAGCTETWNRSMDARVPSGDGQGHGPDPGSDEWMSAIEFRLGIRGLGGLPPRGTAAWCGFIGDVADARDDAMDTDDFRRRVAALEIRYGHLRPIGPIRWICSGDPEDVIVVTYFDTDPESLVAERQGRRQTLFAQPAVAGTRYVAGADEFWQKGIEAMVTWGEGTQPFECRSTL